MRNVINLLYLCMGKGSVWTYESDFFRGAHM